MTMQISSHPRPRRRDADIRPGADLGLLVPVLRGERNELTEAMTARFMSEVAKHHHTWPQRDEVERSYGAHLDAVLAASELPVGEQVRAVRACGGRPRPCRGSRGRASRDPGGVLPTGSAGAVGGSASARRGCRSQARPGRGGLDPGDAAGHLGADHDRRLLPRIPGGDQVARPAQVGARGGAAGWAHPRLRGALGRGAGAVAAARQPLRGRRTRDPQHRPLERPSGGQPVEPRGHPVGVAPAARRPDGGAGHRGGRGRGRAGDPARDPLRIRGSARRDKPAVQHAGRRPAGGPLREPGHDQRSPEGPAASPRSRRRRSRSSWRPARRTCWPRSSGPCWGRSTSCPRRTERS